jgi:hypothetical protein
LSEHLRLRSTGRLARKHVVSEATLYYWKFGAHRLIAEQCH